MATQKFVSIEDYLSRQPDAAQAVLRRVHAIIKSAVPRAEETISYHIPTYRLGDASVVYLAGWKKHFSLYPFTEGMIAQLGDALAPHKVHQGTLQFAYDEPLPTKLIERIVKIRARETPAKKKAPAKKKSPAKKAPVKRKKAR